MTLQIDDPEADKLAKELAGLTGVPVERAVMDALREQLRTRKDMAKRLAAIEDIQRRFAALPVFDNRSDEEILGYDEIGLPS